MGYFEISSKSYVSIKVYIQICKRFLIHSHVLFVHNIQPIMWVHMQISKIFNQQDELFMTTRLDRKRILIDGFYFLNLFYTGTFAFIKYHEYIKI